MPDIKPQLMADAQCIVENHRSSGGDINELVAKYASDHGYSPKVTDALTACVNRHSFKTAMQLDRHDEPAIADAAAVKLAQAKLATRSVPAALPVKVARGEGEELRSKTASVTTENITSVDYTRAVQQQLHRDKVACEAAIQTGLTEIRLGMEKMSHQAHLIKRLGLEKTAEFQQLLNACGGPVASMLEAVLEKAASQRQEMVGQTIAMLVPQALRDFEHMKAASAKLVALAQTTGEAQAKLAKINAAIRAAKNGVSADV
jgi:hypothetical protein